MAGNKRERELARAKYERQQARRATQAGKRRRNQRIVAENAVDVAAGAAAGLSAAMLDRLTLTADRVEAMARGIEAVSDLPDPLKTPIDSWTTARGLAIEPWPRWPSRTRPSPSRCASRSAWSA